MSDFSVKSGLRRWYIDDHAVIDIESIENIGPTLSFSDWNDTKKATDAIKYGEGDDFCCILIYDL